jgi:predicted dienelactone hydrolase
MIIFKNFIVPGRKGRPMSTDLALLHNGTKKPLIIYAHGFNGFKDWGDFNLIAQQFAEAGFVFVKFNFSHNGTTPDHPEEFVDLDAYAQNNYTTQLDELGKMIDWCVDEKHHYVEEIDTNNIYLLGHSLGGGLVILKAAEDDRVKKIATWAAISECKTPWGNWNAEKIQEWKANGVAYTTNSRTKQQMPLDYQLYQDYQENEMRLNIQKAIHILSIPILLCHGSADEAVPLQKAEDLKRWQPSATLFVVDSDHVFGRKHPWTESKLPEPMQKVLDRTIEFFKA